MLVTLEWPAAAAAVAAEATLSSGRQERVELADDVDLAIHIFLALQARSHFGNDLRVCPREWAHSVSQGDDKPEIRFAAATPTTIYVTRRTLSAGHFFDGTACPQLLPWPAIAAPTSADRFMPARRCAVVAT